jgi:hypothetical protein
MLPNRGNQQRYPFNVKFPLKIPQKEINPSIWQHCAGVRALAFGIGGMASKWCCRVRYFIIRVFYSFPKGFFLQWRRDDFSFFVVFLFLCSWAASSFFWYVGHSMLLAVCSPPQLAHCGVLVLSS